ncbi:MAG TPA: arsenate reductase [Sphingobacterium sp.]|nr:arsenate reductase [Sphingobacterium sp.]
MIHVYGIKNCNTVKKALDWLNNNGVNFAFHDFKREPATRAQLEGWEQHVGWEALVNKRGTSWRKLSTEEQVAVTDSDSAYTVLLANNSMIKRPIITLEDSIILGFDEELYKSKLL